MNGIGRLLAASTTAAALCIALPSPAQVPYRLTDLGTLFPPGQGHFVESFAWGVNDRGQVTGWSTTSTEFIEHAFIWDRRNGMVDLGTLTAPGRVGVDSQGRAINNSGHIAGISTDTDSAGAFRSRAFRYSPSTGLRDLGSLGGPDGSALDINKLGQVTGFSRTAEPFISHAFLANPGAEMLDLGTLAGERFSFGNAVNDLGHVTGSSGDGVFLWTPGGGMVGIGISGSGEDLNNRGQITGTARTAACDACAFLYGPGTGTINIGNLGLDGAIGTALNESAQVVGFAEKIIPAPGGTKPPNVEHRAFLYTQATGAVFLDGLLDPVTGEGWQIVEAHDINELGQIVGLGWKPDEGRVRAVLLTPVPEPQTYALMLLGMALVGWITRRRKAA